MLFDWDGSDAAKVHEPLSQQFGYFYNSAGMQGYTIIGYSRANCMQCTYKYKETIEEVM